MSDKQARISVTLIARNFNLSQKYFAKETLLFVFRCGPTILCVITAAIISNSLEQTFHSWKLLLASV